MADGRGLRSGPHLNIPFWLVCGNHDHYGNAQAEVEYSRVSPRWHMPSFYYTFVETVPGTHTTVQFVMVDTVLLVGSTNISSYEQPVGPADQLVADEQWAWLQRTLNASTADYLIVGGHYPVWSIGEHGPTKALVARLLPLLEANNVTAYMSGHDHSLQHLNTGSSVDFFVVGATHKCNKLTWHRPSVPPNALKFHWASGLGGFADLRITPSELQLTMYDQDGTVLYRSPPRAPRRRPHSDP